jgi:hypothetical protein
LTPQLIRGRQSAFNLKKLPSANSQVLFFPVISNGRQAPTPVISNGRQAPTPVISNGRHAPTPVISNGRQAPTPVISNGRQAGEILFLQLSCF